MSVTSSVGSAKAWREPGKIPSLRRRVDELNESLRNWAGAAVPPHIRNGATGRSLAQRCVLYSAFFSAIMLLYRPFMANPHKDSPLGRSETAVRCAKAATNCIRSTSSHLHSIPVGLYTSFHGQQVFVGSILLMHCMRISRDEISTREAFASVEMGMRILTDMQSCWAGARKCNAVAKEFLDFTIHVLQTGKKGVCQFNHSTEGPGTQYSMPQASDTFNERMSLAKKRKRLSSGRGTRMNYCSPPASLDASILSPNSATAQTYSRDYGRMFEGPTCSQHQHISVRENATSNFSSQDGAGTSSFLEPVTDSDWMGMPFSNLELFESDVSPTEVDLDSFRPTEDIWNVFR